MPTLRLANGKLRAPRDLRPSPALASSDGGLIQPTRNDITKSILGTHRMLLRIFKAFGTALLVMLVGCGAKNSSVREPFVAAGLPATDREWLGSDYMLAAKLFTDGKVPLPRFSDTEGRAILERLTSTENLAFHRNKTLPLGPRLEDVLNLQHGANTISKLYLATADSGGYAHTEVARLAAFLLHTSALAVELVDEFIPNIPKDEKYAVRMDGVKKMRSGVTTIFVGIELTLSERNVYSSDDLSGILEAMASTLPILKRAFSDAYRSELRLKLESHKLKFSHASDVARIKKMLEELSDKGNPLGASIKAVRRALGPSLPPIYILHQSTHPPFITHGCEATDKRDCFRLCANRPAAYRCACQSRKKIPASLQCRFVALKQL